MTTDSRRFILLSLFILSSNASSAKRTKRELRFPKGAAFDTAVALTSSLPKGILTDGFVHVLEFHLSFPFPEQFAIGKVPAQKKISVETKNGAKNKYKRKKFRGRRNVKDDERKRLLLKIEDAVTRIGFNGRDCVSRFQCELHHVCAKDSLLEELIVALFRTDYKFGEEECEAFRSRCPVSLLHVLLHSKQMPKEVE